MTLWFSIEVRFLNGRYHGRDANAQPEWPPSPLRLFQAIVAGALSGRWVMEDRQQTEATLCWLETLGAPDILLAPRARNLRAYRLAVPNNQADRHLAALKKGAHLDRLLAGDKELKAVRPWLVGRQPLVYAWTIDDDARPQAEAARTVVRRLVVLGTGVDHAVADVRLATKPPAIEGLVSSTIGASPCKGTLESLAARHKADLARLKTGSLRENRPPVRYRPAAPSMGDATHLLFAFRQSTGEGDAPMPIEPEATAIVAQKVRLTLSETILEALRNRPRGVTASAEEVERLITGRGAGPSDKMRRVRVSPLPSVGHDHADGLLRRVLVSVPPDFPIPPESIHRALAGQELEIELAPSRLLKLRLAPIDQRDDGERRMRERYLGRARVWRSVSPVVLPGQRSVSTSVKTPPMRENQAAVQARIDARRRLDQRALFERALTHAGLDGIAGFRLRREPFDPHQPRADAAWRLPVGADKGSRVWLFGRPKVHAEITFDEAQAGPVLVGDGRFLGLGLFQAVAGETPGRPEVARYRLGARGRPPVEKTVRIADVLRRALMSGGFPPLELAGHDRNGASRDPAHGHAFFLPEDADGDGLIDYLTVYCRLGFSDEALERLHQLRRLWWRDGQAPTRQGEVTLSLEAVAAPEAFPGLRRLIGPSRVWHSITPYFRPRFRKKRDIDMAILTCEQIRREWSLRFSREELPDVEPLNGSQFSKFEAIRTERDLHAADRDGSFLKLRFSRQVMGPIALGRAAHFGLGLFVAEE
ncbi:MAG TPA: type I-U CRISPR-associated protein Csb2 [Stellaceae bacterium]|nr:type I-U CRISPR-associated protein Csb2 [Stellaceae bacterium]